MGYSAHTGSTFGRNANCEEEYADFIAWGNADRLLIGEGSYGTV